LSTVVTPVAWPTAQTTKSLVSAVDLTPTLASLLEVSTLDDERLDAIPKPLTFDGQDMSPILNNPTFPGQEFVHFTYDDNPAVKSLGNPPILFPSIVRTIRTAEWKYSVYFNKDGTDADWELYDLTNDKYEDNNLAGNPDLNIVQKQAELEEKLQDAMNKLGTMPKTFNWPPQATPESRGVNRT
jgi:arylsulfatase A-like enzyme